MSKRQYLLIEDDRDIAELVQLHLNSDTVEISHCADGIAGLELARNKRWDLLILDLSLPGLDGLEVCKRLRANDCYVPVLMLTSRSTELDRVLGLELGADDYVVKPFSVIELQARIKALLRRADMAGGNEYEPDRIEYAPLSIDKKQHSVRLGARELDLTAREFELLWHFAKSPGRVYTRMELLEEIWGYGHDGYEHTVNSHINRLRAKLEEDPANPIWLQTVWGVGYKFIGDTQGAAA